MRFDAKTLQLLKNFSTINPSIYFRRGNSLCTISDSKAIYAKAAIDQEIPSNFAIYDLSRFLSTLSMFTDPEITIEENRAVIKDGNRSVNYTLTDPILITTPPEKNIGLSSVDVKFAMSAERLQETIRAISILGLPEIAIIGNGSEIFVKAVDVKNINGDNYAVSVGKTDDVFSVFIKTENIKFLQADYVVEISSSGLDKFS